MTLLISHKRSVNSRVTISCSYLTIVIGKWCSFLEASCLNRRPGRGTSGTASLSSSLASKLERGSSSGACAPTNSRRRLALCLLRHRRRFRRIPGVIEPIRLRFPRHPLRRAFNHHPRLLRNRVQQKRLSSRRARLQRVRRRPSHRRRPRLRRALARFARAWHTHRSIR